MYKINSIHREAMTNIHIFIAEKHEEDLRIIRKIGERGINKGWAFSQRISYELQYSIISNDLGRKDNSENYKLLLQNDYLIALEDLCTILDNQGAVYLRNQWKLIENNMFVQFIPYQMVLIEKLMRETICPSEEDKHIANQALRNRMRNKVKIIEEHIRKDTSNDKLDNFNLTMKLLSRTYNKLIMNDLYLSADKQEKNKTSVVNRQNVLHYYMNLDDLNQRDFHQLMFIIICMIELYYLLAGIEKDVSTNH